MDIQDLKYIDKIKSTKCLRCPPPDSNMMANLTAYRFGSSATPSYSDFLPPAILNPARQLRPEKVCSAYALSFYCSQSHAVSAWEKLSTQSPQFCRKNKILLETQIHEGAGLSLRQAVVDISTSTNIKMRPLRIPAKLLVSYLYEASA